MKRPEENKTSDGLTAYDVLRIKGCPINLPKARSMTQAYIDYYSLQDKIISWYEDNKHNIRNWELQLPCTFCDSKDGGLYGCCDLCDSAELN